MAHRTKLAAVTLALVAGTVMSGAAEARISSNTIKFNRLSSNRISLNRISLNGIAANNGVQVHRATTKRAKGVSAYNMAGQGTVSSVLGVDLPAK